MSKYRKKPVVIDAGRWWGSHSDGRPLESNDPGTEDVIQISAENPTWNLPVVLRQACEQCGGAAFIHGWIGTWEGGHRVCPGDWIITGVQGEQYPCKPQIFELTYEAVK